MATSKIWARFVAAATISLVVMGTSGLFASADPSQVTPVTVNPSPILLNGRTASANVVNQTALELTLRFSVVDPKGAAVDSSIMISGQGPGSGPVTLAPASTVKIALDMTPRDDTRLVVQVDPRSPALPTGGVVRVPIITTAAAVPAVDAWTSIATFEPNLAVPPYFGTSASIPVEGTCSGLGSDGSVIGTVQANGKAIPVKAACPSADDRVVKVSFEPLDWDGWKSTSYTGNLDLTPADDDSGEVSITLVTTLATWIMWAAVATALLIAILTERWSKAWRQRLWLKADLKEVERLQSGVDRQFNDRARVLGLGEAAAWQVKDGIGGEVSDLKEDLEKASDQVELQAAAGKIATLRDTVAAWPKLPDLLNTLKSNVDRLALVPTLSKAANNLITTPPRAWSSAMMAERTQSVARTNAFAEEWPAESLEELHAGMGAFDPHLTPATHGLFDALTHENDQQRARGMVQNLAPFFAELARLREEGRVGATPGDAGGAQVPGELPGPLVSFTYATQARSIRMRVAMVDWMLLALAVVVVYALGISQLLKDTEYFGWWEVFSAFTWALAAGTVLGPISDATARAGQSLTRLRATAIH